MSQSDELPPVITEPLTVDADGDVVALDGDQRVDIKLTRDAALETGIDLVNTALRIDGGTGVAKPQRR